MMNSYIILFNNMLGVVNLRKILQAQDYPFKVLDIPRVLGKACGLCIQLDGEPLNIIDWRQQKFVSEIYRINNGEYQLIENKVD